MNFRNKLAARIASDRAVAKHLENANRSSASLRRVLDLGSLQLMDPLQALPILQARLRLESEEKTPDEKLLEQLRQRIIDFSNPTIARHNKEQALSICQPFLDVLGQMVIAMLEAAIPVAEKVCTEMKGEEEAFLKRYGLPHSATAVSATAEGLLNEIREQLKGAKDDLQRFNIPLSPNAYCSSLALFNPT